MQSTDVQAFAFNLEENIFNLHQTLLKKQWQPDPYQAFYVRDPKLRHIHKAISTQSKQKLQATTLCAQMRR
jgi:hypothetical protein